MSAPRSRLARSSGLRGLLPEGRDEASGPSAGGGGGVSLLLLSVTQSTRLEVVLGLFLYGTDFFGGQHESDYTVLQNTVFILILSLQ